MKKNKIIINATYANRKPTGLGIFTEEIVKGLISLDEEIFYVFCGYNFLNDFKYKKDFKNRFSHEHGMRGHIFRILWENILLPLNFKLNRGGLLFSTVTEAPVAVRNKVVVVHDIIPLLYPEAVSKFNYYYYKFIVPLVLRTSRHVVFDSESTQRDVKKFYNIDVPSSVINLGYDKKFFYPMKKGFIKKKYGYDKYFFYAGDMRPYKNLKNAIKAFAMANLKGVKFIIAGKRDPRYFPEVEKTVEGLGIKDRVICTGYVPAEDLPHFYRDSLALFFPSKYEGFGLPPLEAMSTGTPVITTKKASLPEVCGNAAYYVDPDDIEDMSTALKKTARSREMRDALSKGSIERAAFFSWDKAAGEYYNLLMDILNDRGQ